MNASLHKLVPVGIITISVLFFVAVFTWGIFPLQDLITEKANTIEADRALQASKEGRIKELPELKETYDHILKNEGVLDMLVSHDQVVPFIEQIETLAHDDGVEIIITNQGKLDPKKKPAPSGVGKSDDASSTESRGGASSEKKKKDETILGNLPINTNMQLRFDVRGKYTDALQFLHQIETLPYALDVVALDIRQWQPTDKATRGDAFATGNQVGADGLPLSDTPIEQHLVQAFYDVVVYTKD
ncbi:MAG: hypothetical protein WAU28_03445 [Candidatus Moraniibacteriota bacterium]